MQGVLLLDLDFDLSDSVSNLSEIPYKHSNQVYKDQMKTCGCHGNS